MVVCLICLRSGPVMDWQNVQGVQGTPWTFAQVAAGIGSGPPPMTLNSIKWVQKVDRWTDRLFLSKLRLNIENYIYFFKN